VQRIFSDAPFVRSLGIELVDLGPGWCETELAITDRHKQQHGYVHAGVQATLADHSAGAAASTLIAADEQILSVEFKLNLLRAARADRLRCRASVLRPGRTITVVEAEVYAVQDAGDSLVSKATVTLATVVGARVAPPG
jgi:uncharacterized protein (TIGR00369 family)